MARTDRRPTYGQGKLYKQPNSRLWWIRYRGRRIPTGKVKISDARDALKKVIAEDADGRRPHHGAVTVGDLLKLVKRDYDRRGLKSADTLDFRIKQLEPFFKELPAQGLTTLNVEAYVDKRLRDGVRGPTVNRELAALRRAYTLGLERDLVTRAPKMPRCEESKPRQGFFESGEWDKVRVELSQPARDVCLFCYWTGCRISEVLSLRLEFVDLDRRLVRLPPETKNGEPRTIPLVSELISVLGIRKEERDLKWPGSPWVFSRAGERVKSIRSAFEAACTRAKVERTIHDFRRTAVRNMTRAGVPRSVAMQISGHKTEAVFRRYDITAEADLLEAAEKLERFLAPRQEPAGKDTFKKSIEIAYPEDSTSPADRSKLLN